MLDLYKILQKTLSNRVECVLVGGLAAITHGASTMTRDVDVCFHFSVENLRKLAQALDDIHPTVRAGSKKWSLEEYGLEQLAKMNNLYLKTDAGDLDLLGEIAGVGNYEEVKKHSMEIELFGFPCHLLDLDSLIKAKEATNRPKDQQVLLELKVIREKLKKK